jgi:H+/Cl- antiporter ClcA
MQKSGKWYRRFLPNPFIRIIIGAFLMIAFTYAAGGRDYNGAGIEVIERAIAGFARPEAFVLKILATAITLGAGFKGGEVAPTFFIGATFGCVVGGLFGLDPGFGAAVGLVALFCGVVNCPMASVILSVELFGAEGLLLFGLACAVSYMLSGYYGLYSSQKIMYSKLKPNYINININTR